MRPSVIFNSRLQPNQQSCILLSLRFSFPRPDKIFACCNSVTVCNSWFNLHGEATVCKSWFNHQREAKYNLIEIESAVCLLAASLIDMDVTKGQILITSNPYWLRLVSGCTGLMNLFYQLALIDRLLIIFPLVGHMTTCVPEAGMKNREK